VQATESRKEHAPRRRWPASEKRRIVELTMRAGASVLEIAQEHGVHPNSLYQWKALYCSGKINAQESSLPSAALPAASATFLPVSVVSAGRRRPVARWAVVPRYELRPARWMQRWCARSLRSYGDEYSCQWSVDRNAYLARCWYDRYAQRFHGFERIGTERAIE